MGSVFSSLTPKKGDEVFHFSRDIVVCIIIQLEKINTMKAYRVVYTEEGRIRYFFFKYRKTLENVFKMCKAHLMIQSIYKHNGILLKKEEDTLNFTFFVSIFPTTTIHTYKHISYYEYHKTRKSLIRIIRGVGLCVIFYKFMHRGYNHTFMKITKFKSDTGVGIMQELCEDDHNMLHNYFYEINGGKKSFADCP